MRLLTSLSSALFQQNTNKIIPIIFKKCDLPSQFAMYHKLPYSPETRVFNFWDKLLVRTFELKNVPPELKTYTFAVGNSEVGSLETYVI